jgi:hypothetical protein
VLLNHRARAALDTLRQSGTPLSLVAPPALGLKTGADHLLTGTVRDEERHTALVRFGDRDVEIERSVLRPALRGRDVGPFQARPRRVVFWGYDRSGRPLARLPPLAAAYINTIRNGLENRSDYRGAPPWTLFRVRAAVARFRAVWADIARAPGALALDEVASPAIPLNTCYIAPCPNQETALVAAAVLCSTWTRVLVAVTADEARGGYRRYNARITGAIPIPHAGPARDRLVELSRTAHYTHVSQSDLDGTVADALGLPPATRALLADLA